MMQSAELLDWLEQYLTWACERPHMYASSAAELQHHLMFVEMLREKILTADKSHGYPTRYWEYLSHHYPKVSATKGFVEAYVPKHSSDEQFTRLAYVWREFLKSPYRMQRDCSFAAVPRGDEDGD